MLRHIIEHCMHYSFFHDNNGNVMRDFRVNEFGAFAQDPARRAVLISLHELHRSVVAHRDKPMEQSLDLFVFFRRTIRLTTFFVDFCTK